mmetsp:Transcript_3586/g.8602  ORF Transcript_3586/g.8602 Transcript_3586/m.8602 type:complete len:101 (+) Transcript_3586:969-1271(+)
MGPIGLYPIRVAGAYPITVPSCRLIVLDGIRIIHTRCNRTTRTRRSGKAIGIIGVYPYLVIRLTDMLQVKLCPTTLLHPTTVMEPSTSFFDDNDDDDKGN